jgi:hypothetical protein
MKIEPLNSTPKNSRAAHQHPCNLAARGARQISLTDSLSVGSSQKGFESETIPKPAT